MLIKCTDVAFFILVNVHTFILNTHNNDVICGFITGLYNSSINIIELDAPKVKDFYIHTSLLLLVGQQIQFVCEFGV